MSVRAVARSTFDCSITPCWIVMPVAGVVAPLPAVVVITPSGVCASESGAGTSTRVSLPSVGPGAGGGTGCRAVEEGELAERAAGRGDGAVAADADVGGVDVRGNRNRRVEPGVVREREVARAVDVGGAVAAECDGAVRGAHLQVAASVEADRDQVVARRERTLVGGLADVVGADTAAR